VSRRTATVICAALLGLALTLGAVPLAAQSPADISNGLGGNPYAPKK